jgi:hypothetical protein
MPSAPLVVSWPGGIGNPIGEMIPTSGGMKNRRNTRRMGCGLMRKNTRRNTRRMGCGLMRKNRRNTRRTGCGLMRKNSRRNKSRRA